MLMYDMSSTLFKFIWAHQLYPKGLYNLPIQQCKHQIFFLNIFVHFEWRFDFKNILSLKVICIIFIWENLICFLLSSFTLVLRVKSACTEILSSSWFYDRTDLRFQPSSYIVIINSSSFTGLMNSPWGTSAGALNLFAGLFAGWMHADSVAI